MSKLHIELIGEGVRELLKSEEIAAVCEAEAARRTRATGMEYTADVYVGRTRVNAAGYESEDAT